MDALMIVLCVLLALLALLLLIGLAAVFYIFFFAPQYNREDPKPDPFMGEDLPRFIKESDKETARVKAAYPYETVSVKSDDGLTLYGSFFRNREPTDKTVLCVHGYNSCGFNDFALMIAPILEHGYNCLLFDHRHCGASEGHYAGFGILESKDLLHWIALVDSYFPGGKIVLYGLSMGASTVMLASGLDLPKTVVGVVEDCGFTSGHEEFAAVLKEILHLPAFPLLNVLEGLTKLLLKFDLRTDVRDCLAASRLPMLFLHGGADACIPVSMCEACYEACGGEKQMVVYEGAAHAQSHFRHPEAYERDFFAFVEKAMR